MKLGGLVGEAALGGAALTEFLPLVAAGEVVRVGSGTNFGLGKYEIGMATMKIDEQREVVEAVVE